MFDVWEIFQIEIKNEINFCVATGPVVAKNLKIPHCLSGTKCYPASFTCITTSPWVAFVAFLSTACTNKIPFFSRNRSSWLKLTHEMTSIIQRQRAGSFRTMWSHLELFVHICMPCTPTTHKLLFYFPVKLTCELSSLYTGCIIGCKPNNMLTHIQRQQKRYVCSLLNCQTISTNVATRQFVYTVLFFTLLGWGISQKIHWQFP